MAEIKPKYYTVLAGNRKPKKVLQGFLKKEDNTPKPGAQEIEMEVGKIQIPNWSSVWGKRIIENPANDQQIKKSKIGLQLTDPDYKGKIEFLEYGDPSGEAIEIRYLTNCRSLDKQYQDTILKLKAREEDALIDLVPGVNDFNTITDATLVQMLKVHARNGDSKSRNPDITGQDYMDYSPAKVLKTEREKLSVQTAAMNLVFSTEGKDDQIAVLGMIQGGDGSRQPDILFDELLQKAKDKPDVFIQRWLDFQREVEELCNDAVELKVLDASQDGILSFFENFKKVVLANNIDASYKGKAMFKYLTDNILNPEIYKAVTRLKASVEQAKTKV